MQESRILRKLLHHHKRNIVGPPALGSLYQRNSLSWAAFRQAEVQKRVNRCAKHSTALTSMQICVVRQ
jgi:hypothetical protein